MRVAGFGFRPGASLASLHDALRQAGGAAGLTSIATADDKAEAPAFKAFASELKLPIQAVAKSHIEAAEVTTQSPKSQRFRGTGSLSEAVALAAAGPGAELIETRRISSDKMATCAVARGANP